MFKRGPCLRPRPLPAPHPQHAVVSEGRAGEERHPADGGGGPPATKRTGRPLPPPVPCAAGSRGRNDVHMFSAGRLSSQWAAGAGRPSPAPPRAHPHNGLARVAAPSRPAPTPPIGQQTGKQIRTPPTWPTAAAPQPGGGGVVGEVGAPEHPEPLAVSQEAAAVPCPHPPPSSPPAQHSGQLQQPGCPPAGPAGEGAVSRPFQWGRIQDTRGGSGFGAHCTPTLPPTVGAASADNPTPAPRLGRSSRRATPSPPSSTTQA